MNALLEVAGDDEDHPLSSLLELTSDLVTRYEQEHHPIEAAEPKDALRFLVESRGLRQEDLSSVVPQSNLSAILAASERSVLRWRVSWAGFLVSARLSLSLVKLGRIDRQTQPHAKGSHSV